MNQPLKAIKLPTKKEVDKRPDSIDKLLALAFLRNPEGVSIGGGGISFRPKKQ